MKRIKITQKGMGSYTGFIGQVQFKDGVSVEPLTQRYIDRLAASYTLVEVDDEGNEGAPQGAAYRLVNESKERAVQMRELPRQSETDRQTEEALDKIRANKAPVERFYTREELETVVEREGIKGLRLIADPWGVRHRGIPQLIDLVLKAQSDFREKHQIGEEKLTKRLAEGAAEMEAAAKAKAEKEAAERAAAERLASTLHGIELLAPVYLVNEKPVPAAVILEKAWAKSGMSLTGWNGLEEATKKLNIAAVIEAMGAVAVAAEEPAEEVKTDTDAGAGEGAGEGADAGTGEGEKSGEIDGPADPEQPELPLAGAEQDA